jgi:three-Cys-motif partner protein
MSDDYDLVGPWTEVKLDILREYAEPYSRILTSKGFYHLYVDGYAAGGAHISRTSGEMIPGSARIALAINPPFREYHLIDADPVRVEKLRDFTKGRADVHVHAGDCNEILRRDVFRRAKFEHRRRALCLLDPYNIDLSWDVVATAGSMKSIEIFVNFMVMDMNMNVLLRDPYKATAKDVARMNRFWGDESWRQIVYELSPQQNLFGNEEHVKVDDANEKIAEAYRQRLLEVAGFGYAPRPLRFVNTIGKTLYYLFFASRDATGNKIVEHIFEKYRRKQGLP